MKTILYFADFSSVSHVACQYAFRLTRDIGAKLILAHIVIPKVKVFEESVDVHKQKELDFKNLKVLHNQVAQSTGVTDIEVEYVVEIGKFSDTAMKIIDQHDVDLVIVGTQGHGFIQSRIYGSHTADLIARITTCPILVVPPYYNYKKPTKIALSTEYGKDVVEKEPLLGLVNLAEKLDAEIIFAHVDTKLAKNTKPKVLVFYTSVVNVPPAVSQEEALKIQTQKAKEIAKVVKKMTDYPKKKYCVMSNDEDILKALKEFVKDQDITLLAMVKKKRGFFENFFHASLTRDMSMDPAVPVLIYNE